MYPALVLESAISSFLLLKNGVRTQIWVLGVLLVEGVVLLPTPSADSKEIYVCISTHVYDHIYEYFHINRPHPY